MDLQPLAPGEKKLSAYNLFIQTELKRLKEADKSLSHQAAFKQATVNWSKNKPAK